MILGLKRFGVVVCMQRLRLASSRHVSEPRHRFRTYTGVARFLLLVRLSRIHFLKAFGIWSLRCSADAYKQSLKTLVFTVQRSRGCY